MLILCVGASLWCSTSSIEDIHQVTLELEVKKVLESIPGCSLLQAVEPPVTGGQTACTRLHHSEDPRTSSDLLGLSPEVQVVIQKFRVSSE